MTIINCATSSLQAYTPSVDKPWDQRRAMHLYRRVGLGANPSIINAAIDRNPADLVKEIVQKAVEMPLTPAPYWADWTLSDYNTSDEGELREEVVSQVVSWSTQWGVDMAKNGLRDRMSWFWHNHFVTKLDDYGCPSWMYRYHKLLQKFALGNFKDFVYEMGLTPAMLIYLNNIQNTRFEQNENYARELYELFTLGADNGYTQKDIEETARAITGWSGIDVDNYCGDVRFNNYFWDPGEKTIFGKTGPWKYKDVIEILFEERGKELSYFICEKLYKHFVNPIADDQVISQLATLFRDENYEIKPVIEKIFQSEHFFDDAHFGTVIPGHIEYNITFINEIGFEVNKDIIQYAIYSADNYGQRVFNPVDVAGWPGNRSWITASALPYRWKIIEDIAGYYYQLYGQTIEPFRQFALDIVSDDTLDVIEIVTQIIDYILPNGLQTTKEYQEAVVVFKAEVPENYFENGAWNLYWEYAPIQVFYLIQYISTLPEYQLK